MPTSPADCAREVLDVVPLVMRTVRAQMRRHRTPGLSVPHFRVLAFLNRNEGANLSEVADYIGLTLPSMSTLMAGLVTRDLVTRQTSATDRRRVTLDLTTHGKAVLEAARQDTQARLAEILMALSAAERTAIVQAMRALRTVFVSTQEGVTSR